ncbi:MAG: SIS domain-containing protein [Candidatus Sabulitectum sp.]|nr:SIS domain-containing protein [Candidatus Sabulitectum sp.]
MSAKNAVKEYIEITKALLAEMNTDSVAEITEELNRCFKSGGKVLLCGNGGSASDASHFAGELVGRFRRERAAMAAIALTTDTAVITAVANDYGYETIFSRQVKALGREGDIFVAITTSGESRNVLKAAKTARESGLRVIAFTSELCKNPLWADLHWKSNTAVTSFTQEQMLVAFHAICYGLEDILVKEE